MEKWKEICDMRTSCKGWGPLGFGARGTSLDRSDGDGSVYSRAAEEGTVFVGDGLSDPELSRSLL
eukprot:891907-Pyramimonas_sp.AAC.1